MPNSDRYSKGFTLAELLIAVFVIGVLSAVAIPYMKGRVDSSKWAEGKATAVSIRTAADAYRKEKGGKFDFSSSTIQDLGFTANLKQPGGDLDGKYFTDDCYSIKFSKNGNFVIMIDASKSQSGNPPSKPHKMSLDNTGTFTEIP